jgi:regulator of RNase E activity RraA
VVGDDDGVVVVARHRLAEARKQHGYHTLQRKEN